MFFGAHVADYGRAEMHADADAEFFTDLVFEFIGNPLCALHDILCGLDRIVNGIVLRERCAPESHHRVADKFIKCSAVLFHAVTCHRQITVQDKDNLLRFQSLGHRRKSPDVHKEDRDLAGLSAKGKVLGSLF